MIYWGNLVFWMIYIFGVLFLSHYVACVKIKYYFQIFMLTSIFFLTPTQIEISNSEYAPSIFTFVYSVLLERNFSTRPLRPIFITIPLGLLLVLLSSLIKKRFFWWIGFSYQLFQSHFYLSTFQLTLLDWREWHLL